MTVMLLGNAVSNLNSMQPSPDCLIDCTSELSSSAAISISNIASPFLKSSYDKLGDLPSLNKTL